MRSERDEVRNTVSASVLTAIDQSVVVLLVSSGGIVELLEFDGDLSGRCSVGTVAHGQLAQRTDSSRE